MAVVIVIVAIVVGQRYFDHRAARRAMDSFCQQVGDARSFVGSAQTDAQDDRGLFVQVITWGETLNLSRDRLSLFLPIPDRFRTDAINVTVTLSSPVNDYLLNGADPAMLFPPAAQAFVPQADTFLRRWCPNTS